MDEPDSKLSQLRNLKNHLSFLKDYGIDEIPLEPNQVLGLKTPSQKTKSPNSMPSSTLDQVQTELGDCQRCKLCNGRKSIVFGSGNPNADLVFVGEGPGADEDEQVDLDGMLADLGDGDSSSAYHRVATSRALNTVKSRVTNSFNFSDLSV